MLTFAAIEGFLLLYYSLKQKQYFQAPMESHVIQQLTQKTSFVDSVLLSKTKKQQIIFCNIWHKVSQTLQVIFSTSKSHLILFCFDTAEPIFPLKSPSEVFSLL